MSVTIAPGVPVEVIAGDAEGRRGVVRAPWPRYWEAGEPLWSLRLTGDPADRIIRASYLRPLGAGVQS